MPKMKTLLDGYNREVSESEAGRIFRPRQFTKNKASDLLVAALESEGVQRIFGVPGEENLDVLESLRNSKIQLVVTRHEQSAAFMAATYGRLTGKPGALNFCTGAAYALLGGKPSGVRPRGGDNPGCQAAA
jgi:uncharacterized protein with PIN domain